MVRQTIASDPGGAANTPPSVPSLIPGGVTGPIPHVDDLVNAVRSYDPGVDEQRIRDAYEFARKMHGEQLRASGEPYYGHPVNVAWILAGLHLDPDSIITALLHDTVEDTDVTLEDIEAHYGKTVAFLVDGVTKLGKLKFTSVRTQQGENLQKFVLAITKDVRVLLVKLADRLHNMQTLSYIPRKAKRERIARETAEIYAPLARRIGVQKICAELEDLSFRYLNPPAWVSITRKLKEQREHSSLQIGRMSRAISERVMAAGIPSRVFGREKRPFSIWRKLERQAITFDELADVYAFRIIVESPEDCYRVLGLIHTSWRCVPERFRDFISVPKPNHYQSLHTTVIGPENVKVELQIRTEEMDRVAEEGVAAHWRYKQSGYAYDTASGGDPLEMLKPLLEILEFGGDPDDFLEHAKLEMFQDQVFAFTPKGKLISLPAGATALDFAYAVHTDIGDDCVGVKINGRERPLRTPLNNGDSVDIIRGGVAEPPRGWEGMVVTGRARSAIRRLIREVERQEFEKLGRAFVDRLLRREGLKGAVVLKDARKRLGLKTNLELYGQVGRGVLRTDQLLDALFPGRADQDAKYIHQKELITDKNARYFIRGAGVKIGVSMHMAHCCSPLPGDRIVGVRTPNFGINVHTIDCEKLAEYEDQETRLIDLSWSPQAGTESASIGRIVATVLHQPGALAEIADAVGRSQGNIMDVKSLTRTSEFFDMAFDVEVTGAKHLAHIIAAMRSCNCVVHASRARAREVKEGIANEHG
jgi:GTP diphosphokinase / guanosine-3',5'-bis(diphosphate) 3'-diphosphatase